MLHSHTESLKLMGNAFAFTAIHENMDLANLAVKAAIGEVQRIEKTLSTFIADSEVNKINEYAGIQAVSVSKEVFDLIWRSINVSKLTQGAFDISYGGVDKSLWNFDTTMVTLPSKEIAKKSVHLVNYKNIILNAENQTVLLAKKGMRIGFGGIGKGYAAEMAKQIMKSMGITNGVVNAAGDLAVWGVQQDGKPWNIGIAIPDHKDKIFSKLTMTDGAIATSGNYEKYITIGDKRYSHTIDPRTGLPVYGIKSVSIICPLAELADALTTPVMVMGIEAGLNMVNQMHHVSAIIIDESDRIFCSSDIKID
jgi:FAD:protein FMN transferase